MNIYKLITDKVIKQLQNGVKPWVKPWSIEGVHGYAFNRISKKDYSFMNCLLLEKPGEYATFSQWKSLGGVIKAGSKSSMVIFWSLVEDKEHPVGFNEDTGDIEFRKYSVLRYYNVFHISQVEGVEPLKREVKAVEFSDEKSDKVISDYLEREKIAAVLDAPQKSAYYSPLEDKIVIPAKSQFNDCGRYYSTVFHEMTHSTGHPKRLNRNIINRFGDEKYSSEELVAEMGASFITGILGISSDDSEANNASYLQSWIKVLKGDEKLIAIAASAAEKAAKFILKEKEKEKKNTNEN